MNSIVRFIENITDSRFMIWDDRRVSFFIFLLCSYCFITVVSFLGIKVFKSKLNTQDYTELIRRIVGWWLVLLPVTVAVVFSGGLGQIIFLFIVLRMIWEYTTAFKIPLFLRFVLLFGSFTDVMFARSSEHFMQLTGFGFFLISVVYAISKNSVEMVKNVSAVGLMGSVYVSSLAISLRHLPMSIAPTWFLVSVVLLASAASDMGAFFVGKKIGKTVIAPAVHQRKAFEGVLGNLLGVVLTLLVIDVYWPVLNAREYLVLALSCSIGASLGDLTSSLLKRSAGVKDWGSLFPGHGGMLDRANSVIVTLYLTSVLFKFF